MEKERIMIERTRRGLPALWEKGGGMTNIGRSQIICGPNGESKVPTYIRRKGPLACKEHALIIIKEGDIIVKAFHHRKDFTISVYRISKILDGEVTLDLIHSFDQGEWDKDPDNSLAAAIDAARRKATCYHCRSPFYVRSREG